MARPAVVDLMRRTGETVFLGTLCSDRASIVYVDKVESDHVIRYAGGVGDRRPLHATSSGKVILAFLSPDEREQVLKSLSLARHTERTVTSLPALRASLDAIRRDGVCVTTDELVPGASGIAAPVFDRYGRVAGACAIGGPTERVGPRARSARHRGDGHRADPLGGARAPPERRERSRQGRDERGHRAGEDVTVSAPIAETRSGEPAPGAGVGAPWSSLLLGVVAVVVGAYGVRVWRYWDRHVSTDDAFVEAHVSPVSARVRGTVVQVLVRDNQEVPAGAPLVRLDPRDLEVKVHQARAALATAESQLRTAAAGVPVTEGSTRSQVALAEATAAGAALGIDSARRVIDERRSRLLARRAAVRRRRPTSRRARRTSIGRASIADGCRSCSIAG